MLMGILSQDISEEGGASRKDHFVGLHLVVVTRQSDIKEVLLFTQLAECNADVGFEVVPPQTKLFRRHPVAWLFLGNQTELADNISETGNAKDVAKLVFESELKLPWAMAPT